MGWLLPLGFHKEMGSFAGYSVSVSTFEIVPLFFQRLFLLMLRFDGLLFWTFLFHARGPHTVRLALAVELFLCLKTSWMSFFCRGLADSFGHQKTFFCYDRNCFVFPMPEEDLWCLKKPRDAWRSPTKFLTLEDIVPMWTPRVPLSCA